MNETIKLPSNVYGLMKKYKDENRSFHSFLESLTVSADIWGWFSYPRYGAQEELLMRAWVDFNNVEPQEVYRVKLPHLATTDGRPQFLSHKDHTFFASRTNPNLQQYFCIDQIPDEYRDYMEVEDELED